MREAYWRFASNGQAQICRVRAETKERVMQNLRNLVTLTLAGAITIPDPDASGEQRFICLGADPAGAVLVTGFTPRGGAIRIISSRRASRAERRSYEAGR